MKAMVYFYRTSNQSPDEIKVRKRDKPPIKYGQRLAMDNKRALKFPDLRYSY